MYLGWERDGKINGFKLFKVDILFDCVYFSFDKVGCSDLYDFCIKICLGIFVVDWDFLENIGEWMFLYWFLFYSLFLVFLKKR